MSEQILHFARNSPVSSGIRTTAAALAPLFIGQLAGEIGIALTDTDGTNRRKLAVMGVATAGGAVACVVGTLVGSSVWLTASLMFLIAIGAGLERGAGFIVGGLWAIALSLWLWPTRPYQLAQETVEAYFRALAAFIVKSSRHADEDHANVNDAESILASPATKPDLQTPTHEHAAVVAAHAKAMDAIVAVRASQSGQSRTGQRLLLLMLNGDRLFKAVIALAEEIEIASRDADYSLFRPQIHNFVQALANVTLNVAQAVARNGAW